MSGLDQSLKSRVVEEDEEGPLSLARGSRFAKKDYAIGQEHKRTKRVAKHGLNLFSGQKQCSSLNEPKTGLNHFE